MQSINNTGSSNYRDKEMNMYKDNLKMCRDISRLIDRRDNNNNSKKVDNPMSNNISKDKSLYKSILDSLIRHLSLRFCFFLISIRRDQPKSQLSLPFF